MPNINVETDTITFFEPLKEENSLTRSTILQSVLGLFSFKKEKKDEFVSPRHVIEESNTVYDQPSSSSLSSNWGKSPATSPKKGSSHPTFQLNSEDFRPAKDKILAKMRPGTLELTPVYKTREFLQGSEVEVRLKNFSTMFRDIPRMISGNNGQVKQQGRSSFSSSSEGNLRQFWMPDEHCHECYECGDHFTTFRRRHHCRICGHIFCKRCCYLLIPGEVIGFHGMLRSCTYCYTLLTSHDPSSAKVNSNSVSMTEYDGQTDIYQSVQEMPGRSSSMLNDQSSTSLKLMRPTRSRSLASVHGSPVDDNPVHMSITSPTTHDNIIKASAYEIFDATPGINLSFDNMFETSSGNLTSDRLRETWAKLVDDSEGLEFRDHRYRLRKFTLSVTGNELTDWLISNKEAATREQACAICQAFLDLNWIKSVVDDRIFHDAYCLFQRGQSDPTFSDSVHYTAVTGSDDLVHVKNVRLARASLDSAFAVDSEPTWVREISNESDTGSLLEDDKDSFWTNVPPLYKPLQSPLDLPVSDEDSSSSSRSLHSVSSYVEIDQNTIKYKRPRDRVGVDGYSPHHTNSALMPPRFVDDSLTEISADYLRSYLAWNGMYQAGACFEKRVVWRESNLHSSNVTTRARLAFFRLQKIYFRHSMLFLQQLLDSENLDRSWADIIVPLARKVCDTVTTNSEVNMNICHYVHVKKLLDGSPSDSRLIKGVVFTKNVVHSGMKTFIDNPAIMLIATPLEYQRKHYKLSTLEPIVQQENEFFKNLALRIVGRNPSVVISQCSVSHKARNLLAEAGISLVINVKQSVMERLARCTGADVARSIDQLQTVALGCCSRFRVLQHYDGQRKFSCSDGILSKTSGNIKQNTTDSFKSLMYVEGCNASKGCTVVLREDPTYVSENESDLHCRRRLSRVKDVFQFLLKIMYHAKLEISYLMDQQGMAESFPIPSKKDRKARNLVTTDSSSENVFVKSMSVESDVTECFQNDDLNVPTLVKTNCNSISSLASEARTLTPEHSDYEGTCDGTITNVRSNLAQSYLDAPSKPLGGAISDDVLTVSNAVSAKSMLFNESMHRVFLSTSPFIEPNLPYLLTYAGENSPLRSFLPSTLFWSDLFCNHPGLTGQTWTKCNRHRTESTDRLDEMENDNSSFRSRSGTSESYGMSQNMWRTPAHQKSFENEIVANAYEETLLAMETDEHLMDKEIVGSSSRSQTYKDKSDIGSSVTSNGYIRMQSQSSMRSIGPKDEMRLSAWEKLIMRDVLGNRLERSSHVTSPPVTSSPVKDRPNRFFSGTRDEQGQKINDSFGQNKMSWKPVDHEYVSMALTMPANSREMKDLISNYRACGSSLQPVESQSPDVEEPTVGADHNSDILEESSKDESLPPLDCLDPRNHQHIFVLFSSYSMRSPNAPNPCVIPWAVDIDFYHGNDITLGGFLERYCFRPSYHCPSPTCKRPMVEHVRSFVHGTTCMNIVLKELAKPITVPDIYSWCWDPVTHATTDLKPLSTDAWSMSFAKFLELRLQTFDSPSHYQHVDDDSDFTAVPPFKSFQFFILRDIVAAFKCFEICVFDITLPPPSIRFDRKTDWRKSMEVREGEVDDEEEIREYRSEYQRMVDEMKVLSKIGYEAMDSIHDMIISARTSHPLDQLATDQSEAGTDVTSLNQSREKYFDELLAQYQEVRYHLRDFVDKFHLKLQSIRLGQLEQQKAIHSSDSEDNDEKAAMDLEAEQCTINDVEAADVEIDDVSKHELLCRLLELTCHVCKVVHDWNITMGAVADFDRASRRGSRSINLYTLAPSIPIRKPPIVAAAKSNKDTILKKANSLQTVNEDADGESELVGSGTDEDASKPEDPDSRQESTEVPNSLTLSDSTTVADGAALGKEVKPGNQIKKLSTEVKPSGVKRISRTASTVSMYVSHLLASSSHTQVSPPFPASEHYLLPNCVASQVVVRDLEPSSIIAYTLRTPEYRLYVSSENHESANFADKATTSSGVDMEQKTPSTRPTDDPCEVCPDGDPIIDPPVEFKGTNSWKFEGKLGLTSSPSAASSNKLPHKEVEFEDSTSKFYCKVYFAVGFKALRAQILDCSEEDYISSLGRCVRWAARGGKSGSAFHKTLDDRLVLKQMSRFDLHSFLELAPSFFEYLTDAIQSKSPTALSKILGVYRVSFNNTSTNQSFKQDILVMENLFYKRNISQVFDLKGSVRNRHVKTDADSVSSFSTSPNPLSSTASSPMGVPGSTSNIRNNQVLLDENLLTIMRDHPLYIHEHTKLLIKKAITDDAHFLSSHEIIDYSLLVGIDEDRKEIVVGIIDYMRTFTWDKKLEMHWKSIVPARHGARSMPTVVHPELYRSRFCEAMDRYFQVVPDRWFEMQAYQQNACH
uniref:1-phosphatidylinositol-3-phosphate 5-kinase n=1 Tax=Phallusia mammillata TaxID=59560 RepID=A0A6F9DPH3_9ASCI|nr:1-phosphatidylinositol 3-phosphate 5-kinase-like [Phallusia mammillata]